MKRSVFSSNGYFDALATYIHEMCHAFGGDSSNAFSQGLTAAMETLLANAPVIEGYRQQWLKQYRGVDGIPRWRLNGIFRSEMGHSTKSKAKSKQGCCGIALKYPYYNSTI